MPQENKRKITDDHDRLDEHGIMRRLIPLPTPQLPLPTPQQQQQLQQQQQQQKQQQQLQPQQLQQHSVITKPIQLRQEQQPAQYEEWREEQRRMAQQQQLPRQPQHQLQHDATNKHQPQQHYPQHWETQSHEKEQSDDHRRLAIKLIESFISDEITVTKIAERYEKIIFQNARSVEEYTNKEFVKNQVESILFNDSPSVLIQELIPNYPWQHHHDGDRMNGNESCASSFSGLQPGKNPPTELIATEQQYNSRPPAIVSVSSPTVPSEREIEYCNFVTNNHHNTTFSSRRGLSAATMLPSVSETAESHYGCIPPNPSLSTSTTPGASSNQLHPRKRTSNYNPYSDPLAVMKNNIHHDYSTTIAATKQMLSSNQRRQQRLIELYHSAQCTETNCSQSHYCSEMKQLWAHLEQCVDNGCTVQHCFSSRKLLAHFKRCYKKDYCQVCVPVRKHIANLNNDRNNNSSRSSPTTAATTRKASLWNSRTSKSPVESSHDAGQVTNQSRNPTVTSTRNPQSPPILSTTPPPSLRPQNIDDKDARIPPYENNAVPKPNPELMLNHPTSPSGGVGAHDSGNDDGSSSVITFPGTDIDDEANHSLGSYSTHTLYGKNQSEEYHYDHDQYNPMHLQNHGNHNRDKNRTVELYDVHPKTYIMNNDNDTRSKRDEHPHHPVPGDSSFAHVTIPK